MNQTKSVIRNTKAQGLLAVAEEEARLYGATSIMLSRPEHSSSSWYHFLFIDWSVVEGDFRYLEVSNPRGEAAWRTEKWISREEALALIDEASNV
jgi:hypothetical protein